MVKNRTKLFGTTQVLFIAPRTFASLAAGSGRPFGVVSEVASAFLPATATLLVGKLVRMSAGLGSLSAFGGDIPPLIFGHVLEPLLAGIGILCHMRVLIKQLIRTYAIAYITGCSIDLGCGAVDTLLRHSNESYVHAGKRCPPIEVGDCNRSAAWPHVCRFFRVLVRDYCCFY